jgi:hypothetical protein
MYQKSNMNSNKIVNTCVVVYGNYEVICGLDSENNLYVGTPTIEESFGFESNTGRKKLASKSFKAFAGKDFKVGKISVVVNGIGQGKVNFYSFDTFLMLLKWQVKEKNEKAIDLVIAGFADSFSDIAYQEFGVKQTKEDRQNWLKARQEGKATRRELTDAIRDYLNSNEVSDNYKKFVYNNITDLINLAIFGRRACKLRQDWECGNPREKMTDKEIFLVKEVENLIMRLIDNRGLEPMDATREAIHRLCLPSIKR